MADRDSRERDIILSPNEYAYVQDTTKGDIVLYVGPTKISLSNTERMVEFREGRFVTLRAEDGSSGVNRCVTAASSRYIILENPAKDANAKFTKGSNSSIELLIGKKVVIPGPATFPLWPGQLATVVDGHKLREDQYLVIRVYDTVGDDDKSVIGTEKIIRGSDKRFYIPSTGLEVIPDIEGAYVRNAVILRDSEYCILLAPNGKRKYCCGPAVVFPEPMEEFLQEKTAKVFRAYQLRKNTGLHVRVVKDFVIAGETAAAGDNAVLPGKYTAGMEFFIKEREGFFFPSENIEVVKEVQPIPIADKEGIYVRDLRTGKITTEAGPKNFLPDPTKTEIVSRTLTHEVQKLYGLAEAKPDKPDNQAMEQRVEQQAYMHKVQKANLSDYKPGRAVSIYIPPSFAVLVTSSNKREVVMGPQTRILDYDEDLEILKLSTGKPKSSDKLLSTCFLLVNGNKVSDIIRLKTSDHVELEILLSYRVSFVAKEAVERVRWFNVNNYVALLCDHAGSIVRASARAIPIEKFHANGTEVIRSAILGEKKGEEKRPGRYFEENGLHIYDVEVLGVAILDTEVNKLLSDSQRKAIMAELEKKQEQMRLDNTRVKETVNREILEQRKASLIKETEVEKTTGELAQVKIEGEMEVVRQEKVGKARAAAEALALENAARHDAETHKAELEIKLLHEKVSAFKEQMSVLDPQLLAVLRSAAEQEFTAAVSKNLSPLAILGGTSIAEILERLIRALPMGLQSEAKEED
jgi:major vault protein